MTNVCYIPATGSIVNSKIIIYFFSNSGHKFNISNGLSRSRHVSGGVESGAGSALRGLDTALEQVAAQQRRETSRTTSRMMSVSKEDHGVTEVRVSLPASRSSSRSKKLMNFVLLFSPYHPPY